MSSTVNAGESLRLCVCHGQLRAGGLPEHASPPNTRTAQHTCSAADKSAGSEREAPGRHAWLPPRRPRPKVWQVNQASCVAEFTTS